MSRTDPQFKLRMPPALRTQVEQAAKAAYRSLNAELVIRLVASFAQEVPTSEPQQVSKSTAHPGLRLLCVLVTSRNGQARTLPIHTLHPMPPRAAIKGRWSLDHYAGLQMRETHAQRPTAEVLARCARNRQARALRPALGSVRAGELSHV